MSEPRPTILVTGAAGAIGSAVIGAAVQEGFRALACDRDARNLARLVERFPEADIATAVSDLESPQACDRVLQSAGSAPGALVHLVGLYEEDDPDAETWQRALDVNLSSAERIAMAFLRHRDRRVRGRIVLFGSIAAEIGSRDHVAYSAAKAGLKGLAHGLARQYAAEASVNLVAPGMVQSPMGAEAIAKRGAQMLATIPLGRFATPADIAPLTLFLCGRGADYITGQTIHVNGGAYMT